MVTEKLFVVRKYIMARSAKDALRKESKIQPDEVFLDADWQKLQMDLASKDIGYGKN